MLCAFPPGEVRLTDALTRLLRHETVLAFHLPGTRYDCSTKLGYLKAMLAFGLAHPELRDDLASHLGDLYKTMAVSRSARLVRNIASRDGSEAPFRAVAIMPGPRDPLLSRNIFDPVVLSRLSGRASLSLDMRANQRETIVDAKPENA